MIYLTKLDDCFSKGLLKEGVPNFDLAKKSLKQSEFFLKEAMELLELDKKQIAVISLYNAYFHTARALLFKDGVKERSHYCIARYLEERYIDKKLIDVKFLNGFETVMSLRHNVQYSTEKISIDEDLNELSNICEEFMHKNVVKHFCAGFKTPPFMATFLAS